MAPTASATITPTLMSTSTPVPTNTLTPSPTSTIPPTPTPTATQIPTATPVPTNTPIPTTSATLTPEDIATVELSKVLPWFGNPPDQPRWEAAKILLEIWNLDSSLANALSRIPWFADGIIQEETSTASALKGIATLNPEIALKVAGLQWVADGVTPPENEELIRIAESTGDPTIVLAVLDYRWAQDGLDRIEQPVWRLLLARTTADPQTAVALTRLAWLADGINVAENDALIELDRLISADETLAAKVISYQWMQNGVGHDETQVLYGLARLAEGDRDTAVQVAGATWLENADRVTSHHWGPIQNLEVILRSDAALGIQLADLFVDKPSPFERNLLSSLSAMRLEQPETFNRMRTQRWVVDGFTREEMAFLVTAMDIISNAPRDFDEMLLSRYAQTKPVSLPLSGEINIWAFQKTPFPETEDVTTQIEVALRALEELTLTPILVKDVIALFVIPGPDSNYVVPASNLDTPWPRGAHAGGHFNVPRNENGGFALRTMFHEVAHYQFNIFPAWFVEGGASFATSYMWHSYGPGSIEEWNLATDSNNDYVCSNGATNLYELGNPGIGYKAVDHTACFYAMGEHFLASLFHSIGPSPTSTAIRDIFALHPTLGRPVTSKDIFVAFERHVLPDQQGIFLELFRTLHGGPLTDDYAGSEDLQPDDPTSAVMLETDTILEGSLDHPFDIDFFSISLDAGQTVSPIFEHEIHTDYVGEDLRVRLYPPNDRIPEGLSALEGTAASMQVEWVAPEDGEYYFSFESSTGMTGRYSVNIKSVSRP